MVAALTPLPVIGDPVRASALDGLDERNSILILWDVFSCTENYYYSFIVIYNYHIYFLGTNTTEIKAS